jgi:iron complex outermembrane recepter protein
MWSGVAYGQNTDTSVFRLIILNERSEPIQGATVQLLQADKLVITAVTNIKGVALLQSIRAGDYIFRVSSTGFGKRTTHGYHFPSILNSDSVHLTASTTALQEVNITARKSYIQQKQGKTLINVGASVTNEGTTVLEVLEKSPGVAVDQNGTILLKGKSSVLVMIDDKPTYLSPGDLNNLLSSMSSSQVDQIELMPNPPAKYDASGNAGVINIKTKKNKQKGFNGTFTSSIGHGVHPKNGENLALNYRNGKINVFMNYNLNYVKYFTDLYALRKYYDVNTGQLTSMLSQPSDFTGTFVNNTIKAGLDYFVSPKTTVGVVVGATAIHRAGNNYATATWQEPSGITDSTIATSNKNITTNRNTSLNLNARHNISDKQDISADFDVLHYRINLSEDFVNQFLAPDGYVEQSRGAIPTNIDITSGKIDYSLKIGNTSTFQAGAKTSHSATDNLASYQNLDNGVWVQDDTKNNHFLYNEDIHAVYSSIEGKYGKMNIQAGVRYENTHYHADQLGNAIQKDSAFSRHYGGLFPSANVSYQVDSSNTFTITAGRRIDRPVYQTLNPFYFIINKYTYETGNPFLLPQYSWNFELSHQYKELFTTTISYSAINNYFSQLFLADTAHNVLLYSQGNVGRTDVFGLSEAVSWSPFNWWQFNFQAIYNHKKLAGFNGNNYTSQIDQLNINSSSQFTIGKIYTAEISGFYITKAKQDIQELQYPTGQLALGISRQILKKKATLKLTARDVFYTGAFSGFTNFPDATEYFKITRDTRVVTLSFTYRFGKSFKTVKRSEGSAADEAGRVGNS